MREFFCSALAVADSGVDCVLTPAKPFRFFPADEPFRAGKEWWMACELLRLVVLTSAIGWMAKQCWMKVLAANIVALFFVLVFVYNRPYRRSSPSSFCGTLFFRSERAALHSYGPESHHSC